MLGWTGAASPEKINLHGTELRKPMLIAIVMLQKCSSNESPFLGPGHGTGFFGPIGLKDDKVPLFGVIPFAANPCPFFFLKV